MRLPLYTHKLSDIGAGHARVLEAAALAGEHRGRGRARVHRMARSWWGTVLARDRASCAWNADLWWAATIIPVLLTQERNPV